MIVSGREIEAEVLERIRKSASALSTRKLAAEVCGWLDWRGPGGRYQISVAVGILRQLREMGLVSLGEAHRSVAKTSRVRRAESVVSVSKDAANGLTELTELTELEQVGPIELIGVGSRFTKLYGVWRQLLEDHHYLGSGPLAGHQLRYLIKGQDGWLGALAFSGAALRVEGRERWIGWSGEARRENLPYVINNSRFLILPSVRVKNLASHVLAMALRTVGQDWFEAFGYRPVLVETFVETGRFHGTSYLAANWKLIGMTQGRGRQDPDRTKCLPKKILLAYALAKDFRERLCAVPASRRLVPLPRPQSAVREEPRDWAEEEFGQCELGDERLRQRLMTIGRDFYARPMMGIAQACGQRARTKAVYRFFDHARVNMASVLKGHYLATARRAQREKVVLAVQDTSELNYSAHPATELLGPICDKKGVIGMLVHDTMAYNSAGTALGLIDVQCWVREESPTAKRERRYELEIEQKESSKWLVSWRAAQRLQEQCPQSLVVSVGDREADVYELFVLAHQEPGGAKLLVRAAQERVLQPNAEGEQSGVWEFMAKRMADGKILLKLPRTPKRKARTAQIEIRYAPVELKAPKRKPGLGPIPMWAVTAVEIEAPAGEEPVEWKLLTSVEVGSLEKAVEVLRWYSLRFQIEVYHRTLKSGCQIEERQLGNAERIEACLAIDMVVAWRIVRLTQLGRETPEVPCTVYFEEAQWKALVAFVTKDARPPEKVPTLREATRMMAMRLGGFLGRKSDGEPGTETIWRGLQRLDDITGMWVVMVEGKYWKSLTDRELDST